jgi:hypothetical protein
VVQTGWVPTLAITMHNRAVPVPGRRPGRSITTTSVGSLEHRDRKHVRSESGRCSTNSDPEAAAAPVVDGELIGGAPAFDSR